ncbi:unnamed protein product [Hymenolepis diminuta]|uniref:Uncharacterized protein n=1 Tax=Hymenolepis diminuta TaxID=6216 RepID=A0A564Y2K8_HYMDI|nr:unnamed protein product [Hymenolepis diminuta]VUZ41199.1 unnamed protein product [Hymenolepis diminuta]
MRRQAIIVSVKAKHMNIEIAISLKVTRSIICKVRKELVNEKNGDETVDRMRRKKEHCQRSTDSFTTFEFVRRVLDMMNENPAKSVRDILPNKHPSTFKCLKG